MKKIGFSIVVVLMIGLGTVATGMAATTGSQKSSQEPTFNHLYKKELQHQTLPLQ